MIYTIQINKTVGIIGPVLRWREMIGRPPTAEWGFGVPVPRLIRNKKEKKSKGNSFFFIIYKMNDEKIKCQVKSVPDHFTLIQAISSYKNGNLRARSFLVLHML